MTNYKEKIPQMVKLYEESLYDSDESRRACMELCSLIQESDGELDISHTYGEIRIHSFSIYHSPWTQMNALFRLEYYDPDRSYEDDVRAWFSAAKERAEDLREAIGPAD